MERLVTPPRRGTSPSWSPPPPCEQALRLDSKIYDVYCNLVCIHCLKSWTKIRHLGGHPSNPPPPPPLHCKTKGILVGYGKSSLRLEGPYLERRVWILMNTTLLRNRAGGGLSQVFTGFTGRWCSQGSVEMNVGLHKTNPFCGQSGIWMWSIHRPTHFPGVQGWRSGESTRLPPMWPGFDSQTRRHMWVELVGSLLCTKRFLLSSKTNIWLDCVNC